MRLGYRPTTPVDDAWVDRLAQDTHHQLEVSPHRRQVILAFTEHEAYALAVRLVELGRNADWSGGRRNGLGPHVTATA